MKKLALRVLLICVYIFINTAVNKAQTWAWAKNANGTGSSNGVCKDASGNVFITGSFNGPAITFSSYTLSAIGGTMTAYLVKYDSGGNVLWVKNSSGGNAECSSVITDAAGNVYVTGTYHSPTINFGSFMLTSAGKYNLFLVKYDQNGNVLWAKSSTGQGQSECGANSVCTDASGNSFITGYFAGASIAFGSINVANTGNLNIFLVKYDANGQVIWAKSPNGPGYNTGSSVSTDITGNVFVTGVFQQQTITFGSITLNNTGNNDVFLAKYDVNGNVLWAKNSVGTGDDRGTSVCTDVSGNAYVTGLSTSPTITFGSQVLNNIGAGNTFLTQYDSSGNALWAKNATGIGSNNGRSVCTDVNKIYLLGSFYSPVTFDSQTITPPVGSTDPLFIIQYDLNGNLIYSSSLSSGGSEQSCICVDNSCNVYVTGKFQPNFFNVGIYTLIGSGSQNPFIAKMSFNCPSVGLTEFFNKSEEFIVFPNPNNGSFKTQINNNLFEGAELILINSLGQIVFRQKIIQNLSEVYTSGLQVGLYNCILLQNNLRKFSSKILIE